MRPGDTYNFRSALGPALAFSIFGYEYTPPTPDYPYDWHRRMIAEYRRARPFFYGDFYPLTPCPTTRDALAAYQMHRTDLEAGFILAFRRDECPYVTVEVRPQGLDPDTRYEFQDADSGATWQSAGRAAGDGLRLTLENRRESRLVFYGPAAIR
jgi:alpha-galactosidase